MVQNMRQTLYPTVPVSTYQIGKLGTNTPVCPTNYICIKILPSMHRVPPRPHSEVFATKIQNPGGSSLTKVLTRDCLSLPRRFPGVVVRSMFHQTMYWYV